MAKIQICSVAPHEFRISRHYNYGLYIPPCLPGEGYSSTFISDQQDVRVIYHGLRDNEIERIPHHIPAEEIVKDIFQSETPPLGMSLADEGVFVPASVEPTEEELVTARRKRREWLVKCVQEGDVMFGKYGPRAIEQIPDVYKRAATEIGARRDWVFVPDRGSTQCEGCGSRVTLLDNGQSPILCANCGFPLDKQRAMELNLWQPKRPFGRPRKEEEEVAST